MKALVLLHGWGMNPAAFDALHARLAPHYEVYVPALPGYAASPRCEPYTLPGLVNAVAAAAPERCAVAGWSLGGQVALAWARALPRQVERLALIATTPCFVRRRDWSFAPAAHVFDAFAAGLHHSCKTTVRRFISLQAQGDAKAKYVAQQLRASLERCAEPSAETLNESLNVLRVTDLRSDLAAIEQEVLVMHGEHDMLVPVEAAEYLNRALPRGRLVSVRGAGHALCVSEPGQTGRLMQEFFG
ncbi:MAG TPA: alpha/beta fold hydrolase [Burkholderiales bacterium]|nr:alpha/beta fold hydrolase [Burkholderiales bacterium]